MEPGAFFALNLFLVLGFGLLHFCDLAALALDDDHWLLSLVVVFFSKHQPIGHTCRRFEHGGRSDKQRKDKYQDG